MDDAAEFSEVVPALVRAFGNCLGGDEDNDEVDANAEAVREDVARNSIAAGLLLAHTHNTFIKNATVYWFISEAQRGFWRWARLVFANPSNWGGRQCRVAFDHGHVQAPQFGF